MYLKVTNRCNMTCRHCIQDSGPVGDDMPRDVFLAALAATDWRRPGLLILGGGEPTIHPAFTEYLDEAVRLADERRIHVTTNGSMTAIALDLAARARRGEIGVMLSLDEWHDPIDPVVVEAWHGLKVRSVEGASLKAKGRARRNGLPSDPAWVHGCTQPMLVCEPNGEVRYCACENATIVGDVLSGTVEIPVGPATGCDSYGPGGNGDPRALMSCNVRVLE